MDLLGTITNRAEKIYYHFVPTAAPVSEAQQITAAIKKAHSDLEQAESIFNELTDNAAIDFAVYDILAARAKYSYLIKLAKEKNIHF